LSESANVNTPNEAYKRMARRWELPEALMGGTFAMRDKRENYLPQWAKESDSRYKDRLDQAVLLEKYRNTIESHSARPFSEPVQLLPNDVDLFSEIAQDVDLSGRDITVFARERMRDLLIYGKTHILCEYPNTIDLRETLGRELTLADERVLNLRPYMVGVNPASLVSWNGERVGGVEKLDRINIRYRMEEPDPTNEYQIREQDYVVVWRNQTIETWKLNGTAETSEDEWLQIGESANTLGRIPLVTVYANRKGLLECDPPYEGLAFLNGKHFRNQSDQDTIESIARVPMLFFRGFSAEDIASVEVGPYKIFGNKDPQSDVHVVETNGSAVKVGSESLKSLEDQMDQLAMSPLKRKSGNPTATELAIQAGREVSDIEAYVMLLERGLRQALQLCAEWTGSNLEAPEVVINEDLGYSLVSGREMEELREDYKLGVVDRRTYLNERKRRGLYHESIDTDEVLSAVETDSPFTTSAEAQESEDTE